jgi:hypothetical protein
MEFRPLQVYFDHIYLADAYYVEIFVGPGSSEDTLNA